MDGGRVVQIGRPMEVYREPASTFVAEFIVTVGSGDPPLFAVGASIGNGLEAAAALLLLRRVSFRPSLERGRDVVVLILGGAVLAALAGALVSVSARTLFVSEISGIPFPRLLAFWWLTHANGILLGAPLLLAWWHGGFDRVRALRLEAIALGVAVLALGFLLFDPLLEGTTSRRFLYVPFPILIWSAFRFRLPGAAFANLLVALPVMASTAMSRGPFVVPGGSPGPDALFQLWIFIAVNAVTSLFVAAVVEEREREVAARLAAEAERREMSERVARTRRVESLGVLAGGVAHDFNNLLVSIMGHAELASLKLEEGHSAGESVQEIMRASQRAAEVCRQMQAYAGRGRMSNGVVQLGEVATEMTELLAVSFGEGVRVHVDVDDSCGAVWGDVTQLRRVTLNLLTNAAAALGESGGTIRVTSGPIGPDDLCPADLVAGASEVGPELVHLTVEDDGPGLAPSLRERIFEPFFSTRSPGRGLGLAAVLGIVVAHDGLLELRSAPGGGARFRIVLPVTDREDDAETRSGLDAPDAEALVGRVLVADDEPGVREVTAQMLSQVGIAVDLAADGEEAVRRFRAGPDDYDAVILDISIPRADGIVALTSVRALRPDVPVLLMTGNVGDAERVEVHHRVPVLTKPFRLEEITAALYRASRVPSSRG